MELEVLKQYLRVDYDDDDDIIKMMQAAVMDEMKELIPKFDEASLTNRQKLLVCAYVKELYDGRGEMTNASAEKIRFAVQSMMLKETLR